MTAQRKFPIPYDYFKAIVALFLLLLVIWAWRSSGPAPTMSIAVDPSGVVTFSGEAKPGATATITIQSPDGKLSNITARADDAGRWLISKRLDPGSYEAVVSVGGRKSQPQGFEVPRSAALSEITFEQSGSNPYLISGRATPNNQLLLLIDGVQSARLPVGPDGTWRYELDVQPGNHTVQLAYSSAPEITSSTYTIDLPPRQKVNVSIGQTRIDKGTVQVSGTAQPGTVVYLWVDGKPLQRVEAGSSGNWSATLDLSPGEHKIKARGAEDENPGSQALTVTVPATSPSKEAGKGFAYTVRKDDWLSKLAREYLGSEDRYREIREATNAKARNDPSFATIEDDNLIYPGEKIWIPAR
ncbi:LysM peptidoglycan-binding domain-containing protein [Oceanithermus sp.]